MAKPLISGQWLVVRWLHNDLFLIFIIFLSIKKK